MPATPAGADIEPFVHEWYRCLLETDLAGATRLRTDDYRATLPGGVVLTRDAELALLASSEHDVRDIAVEKIETRARGSRVTAVATTVITTVRGGAPLEGRYTCTLKLRRNGPGWRAVSSRIEEAGAPPVARRSLLHRAASRAKRLVRGEGGASSASFQEMAYLPYQPGRDFVIPPNPAPAAPGDPLPIPPKELWAGYAYPTHGALHVKTMLDLVHATGFAFAPNDRILELGCAAGRMIRHLRELADSCEIWGTDISAEHIYWCKANLSPPFHFATTTKVPHLPFEDRSFRFIYCGSVFTHIDDLADAWLLELHRILAPDGRLYVTIHDNHTIRSFEDPASPPNPLSRRMASDETFQRAKSSFGMMSLGRDHESQIFYDTDYFTRMAGSMFEVLSATPHAYFYQTGVVLRRKQAA